MRYLEFLCLLLLCNFSQTALACRNPPLPEIPSKESLRPQDEPVIKSDTLRYLGEMVDYVACIQAEHEAADDHGAASLHLSLLATRNNMAVAEVEAIREIYESRIGPIGDLAVTGAVDCIRGGPRFRATVVDSQNMLFYGRDGIYRNILQQHCPLLRPGVRVTFGGVENFTAPSRFGQGFCNDQLIGVEGNTCKLGLFLPISESEAEDLLRGDQRSAPNVDVIVIDQGEPTRRRRD